MSLFISVDRVSKVYHPGETVTGTVTFNCPKSINHNGISVTWYGGAELRRMGLWNTTPTKVEILSRQSTTLVPSGKLPTGTTEFKFSFPLGAQDKFHETYHGFNIDVSYLVECTCVRKGLLSRNLVGKLEFIVEHVADASYKRGDPVKFSITAESLKTKGQEGNYPELNLSGYLATNKFGLTRPLTGSLVVDSSEREIQSIDIQLVRAETTITDGNVEKEATEVQNIQIVDGNLTHKMKVPLFMVFPRLFCCPTVHMPQFKIEFEVNLLVLLEGNNVIKENFPVTIVRA